MALFALYQKCHTWDRGEKLLSPTSESHMASGYIGRPDETVLQGSGGGVLVNNLTARSGQVHGTVPLFISLIASL